MEESLYSKLVDVVHDAFGKQPLRSTEWLRFLQQHGAGMSDYFNAYSVLEGADEIALYLVLIGAGCSSGAALAVALDTHLYAKLYAGLDDNAARRDKKSAKAFERSTRVILYDALAANKRGEYAKLSVQERRQFVTEVLADWVSSRQ